LSLRPERKEFQMKRLLLAVAALAVAAALAVPAAFAGADAAQPQQAAAGCALVSANVGAVDVDAAGLVTVHVDPVGASVQLNGLLGTLLCGLLGGLGGVPAPAAA
jgi:hypothetical protein